MTRIQMRVFGSLYPFFPLRCFGSYFSRHFHGFHTTSAHVTAMITAIANAAKSTIGSVSAEKSIMRGLS